MYKWDCLSVRGPVLTCQSLDDALNPPPNPQSQIADVECTKFSSHQHQVLMLRPRWRSQQNECGPKAKTPGYRSSIKSPMLPNNASANHSKMLWSNLFHMIVSGHCGQSLQFPPKFNRNFVPSPASDLWSSIVPYETSTNVFSSNLASCSTWASIIGAVVVVLMKEEAEWVGLCVYFRFVSDWGGGVGFGGPLKTRRIREEIVLSWEQ